MEQNHELPSSFQETERCFYVCRSGCGRIACRHRYSPNALFRAYFLFPQYDAKPLTVQWTEENTMALDVPGPVAAYLAGEVAKDADAISCCFTETVVSTTRGVIIAAVIPSVNGNKRWTRNTDTCCSRSTFKRMETR